jgi:hypothetical protein
VTKGSVINEFNSANMTSIKEILNWYKMLYRKKNRGERGNNEVKALRVRSVAIQILPLQTREINSKGSNKLLNSEYLQVNKRKKTSSAEDRYSETRKRSKRGELVYAEVCKVNGHINKEL